MNLTEPSLNSEPPCSSIVRLTTSYWHDERSMNVKRKLRFLKRMCTGHNVILEDCHMIGAEDVVSRIVNLDKCEDGLYSVVTCNESSQWETPHIIEDYDYELIPLK